MHLTQADIRRTIRAAFVARSPLSGHADGLVGLLTRAGVVDDHGNLHSPVDGKFIAKPLSLVSAEARKRLADIVKQPGGKRTRLVGGDVAETSEVLYPDGSVAIHKRYVKHPNKAKVEYAVSLVGEALGARVPAVTMDGDDAVYMGRAPGRPGRLLNGQNKPPDDVLDSDAGVRLGLLDILTANGDRHGRNWHMAEDGPIGIDHGEALRTAGVPPPMDWMGFARAFIYKDQFFNTVWRSSNPLSPADVAMVRPRLEALGATFDRLGLSAQHRDMMRRLDEIGQRAKGAERVIA